MLSVNVGGDENNCSAILRTVKNCNAGTDVGRKKRKETWREWVARVRTCWPNRTLILIPIVYTGETELILK